MPTVNIIKNYKPTVIFTGAGASRAFGLPTTAEFMEIARKASLPEPWAELMSYFKHIYGEQTIDIEMALWELGDLLGFIQEWSREAAYKNWLFLKTGQFSRHANNSTRPLNEVVSIYAQSCQRLMDSINRLVYDTYWHVPEGSGHKTLYKRLIEGLAQKGLDIFTTNYDLCLEEALMGHGFSFGCKAEQRGFFWSLEHYNDHFNVYKLHGSIDWKRDKNGRIYTVPEHNFTTHDHNAILYPGFKGEPNGEPFIFLHEQLRKSLKQAKQCVVIGFSFRDEHINSIFADAIKDNTALKIILWNPVMPDHAFPSEKVIAFQKPFSHETIEEFFKVFKDNFS